MPADFFPGAPRSSNAFLPLPLLIVLLLLPGCIVGDFITAYFNTYYNASRLFREAEMEVWNRPEVKKTGKDYLLPFNIPASTKTKFTGVIEKCSKLLQYHPDSRFVPDALLMIGEAYYYEDENESAERKFVELISGYPSHSLALEGEMWLSYAYYRMNEREKAGETAKKVVERSEANGNDALLAKASLLLAQMALEDRDYKTAEQYLKTAAERSGTREEAATDELRLAEAYASDGAYKSAEAAYTKAEQSANDYLGEYRGSFGRVRMLDKQGEYDESLLLLQTLRSNLNYKEFFAELDLERANVLRNKGDIPAAVAAYRYVDTAYAHSEFSASSYYQLGRLYEKKLGMYDSARAAYDKGRLESGTAPVTPLLAVRATLLTKYVLLSTEIARYDSMLSAPHDSVAVAADTASADSLRRAPAPPVLTPDTIRARREFAEDELAGLFYAQLGERDSAEVWFLRLLREHPKGPYTPRAFYILAQIYSQDSTIPAGTSDSLYTRIVKEYPESPFASEAARILGMPVRARETDVVEVAYARAESLMTAGRADEAIDSLDAICRRYPSSPLAPKAQYAQGWVYENMKQEPDSAIVRYETLVKLYPSSEYARQIRPALAEVALERSVPPAPKDSSKSVEHAPPPQEKLNQEELPRRDVPTVPGRKPGEAVPLPPSFRPAKPDTALPR